MSRLVTPRMPAVPNMRSGMSEGQSTTHPKPIPRSAPAATKAANKDSFQPHAPKLPAGPQAPRLRSWKPQASGLAARGPAGSFGAWSWKLKKFPGQFRYDRGLIVSPILLSLTVGLAATAISLPPGVFVAWVLERTRFPGKWLLHGLVLLPLVLPPVVTGYLLLKIFSPKNSGLGRM